MINYADLMTIAAWGFAGLVFYFIWRENKKEESEIKKDDDR